MNDKPNVQAAIKIIQDAHIESAGDMMTARVLLEFAVKNTANIALQNEINKFLEKTK